MTCPEGNENMTIHAIVNGYNPCKTYGGGFDGRRAPARHEVTCKRCLASLAKRDREFQRKARRSLRHDRTRVWAGYAPRHPINLPFPGPWPLATRSDAARAIAREEGRAP